MSDTPYVHRFDFEGRSYRLYKRQQTKDAPWYFRLQRAGDRKPRCLETNVAENAITKARAMIRAAKSERWDEFLEKTALRKISLVTLGQIHTQYRAYPHRKPAASTRELNIHALNQIAATQHPGQDPETLPLTVLNEDLVWNWKQTILTAAAGETNEARHRQLLRSANSRLTQARSLFTPALQSHYKRHAKLTLPKTLDGFLKEPKFPSAETGKTDYWPPSDNVIAATFTALEQLIAPPELLPVDPSNPQALGPGAPLQPHVWEQNRNMYVAIWLALGFGLRKSEIAAARANWFPEINGLRYCAGDALAKNKRFPRVRCQLGAWQKLAPHLAGLDPGAHVILGTDHERLDDCYRRISHWMRRLGWNTQKALHEWRSYAGSQIAMGDRTGPVDLRAAQEFLRHANITTTENFYMRYLKSQLKEVTLQIPIPQPFIPKILQAAAQD